VYGPPGYAWTPQPQGPQVVWAVLLWLAAAAALFAALICGAFAAFGLWSDNQMDTYGVTTTATVIEVNRFADTYTVEFTTEDNQTATATIIWPSHTPAVGDQVDVTYDSQDPSYATEAGSPEDMIMAGAYGFFALVALAVAAGAVIGAVLVHRARGKAQRRPAW
jgi:hypothetical protein